MKDFTSGLDERLRQLAADAALYDEPAAAPSKADRPRRRFRRPAILGSLTAALGVVGATLAMNGTSLADLPILGTPTTDATSAARGDGPAKKAGVDFSKGHAFGTPQGPGYVLLTPDRKTICVTAPDPGSPGSYASQCGGPLSRIEREGLSIEAVGDLGLDPDATSLFAFVLPEGAKNVRIRTRDGRTRAAKVESGVVADEIRGPVTISWTVDGRRAKRVFEGPFPKATSTMLTCPDGRMVTTKADIPLVETGDGGPGRMDPAFLRKLCR